MDLKANTAVDVLIGPFVDSTDGDTTETGLTIAQADVRLSKNGQNMAQKSDVTSCVHDELGYYNCELDATDTNTEGSLVLVVHESGALTVRHEFNILSEAAWDSLYGAKDTGYMDVNVKAVSEDTTAADNLESACDNYSATRGLSGTALPAVAADGAGGLPISDAGGLALDTILDVAVSTRLAPTVASRTLDVTATGTAGIDWANVEGQGTSVDLSATAINLCDTVTTNTDMVSEPPTAAANADAVWDEAKSGHVGAGSFGEEVQAHSLSSEISALNDVAATDIVSGGAITTSGGAVSTVTTATNLTNAPTNGDLTATMKASVNTEVDNSMVTYGLDHLLAASVTGTDVTDDSIIARLVSASATADWDDFDNLVASLQAISESVGSLSVGSAAISVQAESYTLTTGTQSSGTVSDTETLNGVFHQHTDTAGVMELYYQHDVTGAGVAVNAAIHGYINSANDTVDIYAYDWGGTAWDQVGTIAGQNGSTVNTYPVSLLTRHTGTGANAGKVRIRLYAASGLTTATLYVDQIFVSYSVVSQTVGYSDGAIWVDTNASNTNTEIYVDGTADNPVSTWAAALTLSSSLGIIRFHIINGSAITLTGNSDNYTLIGNNWTLAIGGQSVAGTYIQGASTVSGTGTGSGVIFSDCKLANGIGLTIADCFAFRCGISGDITFTAAGTYYFDQCYSGIAGTGTPSIDFGAAVANTNVNFRHYSGGIEIKNMGATGTDSMSLEGHGQYVLNANCVGGTLSVRGLFKKTDNSLAVTIDDNANFKSSIIHYGIARTAGSPGGNQIQMATTASSSDGAYDPSLIFLESGTGAGQSRLCYQYDGTTRIATVDRDWKVTPDATTEYRVMAHPGREHVNEGLAQAGAAGTITLNALASSSNDAYNHQIVFLRSGTGEDQVRSIIDYNGTTKVATLSENWAVNPDSTTGYVILPNHIHEPSEIVDEWETQSQADPTGFHVNVLEVNGTSQTANDNGADVNAILSDTNAILLDTGTDGVQVADKTGYALTGAANDAIWQNTSSLGETYELLLERIYQLIQNKLSITDATGAAVLRNVGDSANLASWSITDDDTTTLRTEASWV